MQFSVLLCADAPPMEQSAAEEDEDGEEGNESHRHGQEPFPPFQQHDSQFTTDRNLLLIGVLTSKSFLKSRVLPSLDTWVQTIPGKVKPKIHTGLQGRAIE